MARPCRSTAASTCTEPATWQRDTGRAWLAAAGGMLAVCVAYGLAYSFGQFLAPIVETFQTGDGAGSLIFSVTSLLGFGLGVLTGPAGDRLGPRGMLVAGAVFLSLGLYLTAISSALWQAYLAYGLGMGLSLACVYVPVLAAVGRWFDRRRASATGLVVTGVGIAAIVSSPLSAWLVAQLGWRSAYKYYAVAGGGLLLVAAMLIGRPPGQSSANAQPNPPIRVGFRRIYVSTLLVSTIIYVPYVHLALYAERMGIGVIAAAALVSTIGISNIAGRLAVAVGASRFRSLVLFKACYLGLGLSSLVWMAANRYDGLLVFAVLFGICHGGYSSLIPIVVADQFGLERLGKTLGVLYTAVGVGSAIGPPLTGYLVQDTGGYVPACATLTVLGLLGAGVLLTFRGRAVAPILPGKK